VIADGKLAVILGIEVDYPFNCRTEGDLTEDQLRQELDRYFDLGVRYIFPIHFGNNGFGGTAFQNALIRDGGGGQVSGRNPLGTVGAYTIQTEDAQNLGYTYRTGRRNVQGLTDLGKTLIRELINRGMVIDIDHMSAYARADTLDICEQLDCPVVSGHTGFVGLSLGDKRHEGQLTDLEIERIRNLGGMVNVIVRQGSLTEIGNAEAAISLPHVCGNSANTFAQAYLYAINKMGNEPTGFGTDFNGFAGLPGPRFGPEACPGGRGPGDQPGEVTYPFVAAATGTTMDRSVIGDKTFDINTDGLAHVGMLPDFIADLEAQGVTGRLLDPLLNSASGYVTLWGKAWDKADSTRIAADELAGFVSDFPGSGGARVFYRGRDGHVWELYLPRSSGAWSSADLTAAVGGAPAAGELAGFVTDFPGSGGARVVYRAEDGHVWELYLPRSSSAWSSADLTAAVGG
jgi:microsomal dipeptidase-like Zn-dependent dipeptidase